MKTLKFFSIISVLFIAGFISCKKDKNTSEPENAVAKYFTVKDGTFQNSALPTASTGTGVPVINNLQGNASILAGGTNPLSITTDATNASILVSVSGENGYYKISPTPAKSTAGVYLVYLLVNQNLAQNNFSIVVAVMNSAGLVSEHQTIAVHKIAAGTGKLQISCSWDKLDDVDLHLVEPNGEEIYYGNSTSANGGDLDVDSNAGCTVDGINNENITYKDSTGVTTEAGMYIVRVDLWSACDITDKTDFIVNAYYKGALIATTSGSNPYTGNFVSTDADEGASGNGREIMRFNISASKMAQSGDVVQLIKFGYPNHKKILSPQKIK
jgi:hypothetical protein